MQSGSLLSAIEGAASTPKRLTTATLHSHLHVMYSTTKQTRQHPNGQAISLPHSSTQIDTILLKVASRCNLNCGYCYVYQMEDDAWRLQPKRMPEAIQHAVVQQLANVRVHQANPFSVVLHGGEPLLIGIKALRALCSNLRSVLPLPWEIHVQTNGVLLTHEVIDVLVQYNVGISVSLDGPSHVHDQFRVDHSGKATYQPVRRAISRLTARSDARPLFAGVLAVIDPYSNPSSVYSSLKDTGAPSLDFLVRDGNHTRLPFGKKAAHSTEFGQWLVRLFDDYIADRTPPRVRIFDDMVRLILGGSSHKEGVGTTDYGILVIDTDGRISKNDTLKVAHKSADKFEDAHWSILSDNLLDIVRTPTFASYYHQQRPTSEQCRDCPELLICGGGMVAHRWSDNRGFDNPSVFCADQIMLIGHIRKRLEQIRQL